MSGLLFNAILDKSVLFDVLKYMDNIEHMSTTKNLMDLDIITDEMYNIHWFNCFKPIFKESYELQYCDIDYGLLYNTIATSLYLRINNSYITDNMKNISSLYSNVLIKIIVIKTLCLIYSYRKSLYKILL